jgi:hypothetical protein
MRKKQLAMYFYIAYSPILLFDCWLNNFFLVVFSMIYGPPFVILFFGAYGTIMIGIKCSSWSKWLLWLFCKTESYWWILFRLRWIMLTWYCVLVWLMVVRYDTVKYFKGTEVGTKRTFRKRKIEALKMKNLTFNHLEETMEIIAGLHVYHIHMTNKFHW